MVEHRGVLLAETIEYLAVRPDGTYVDCTCGLGGHTRAIAERLTTGMVLALDRDGESLKLARERTEGLHGRIEFRHTEFSKVGEAITAMGWQAVDGIVADLGVSMWQLR